MEVNDKVICISGCPPQLIEGDIYTITDHIVCSCGVHWVSFGVSIPNDVDNSLTCDCNKELGGLREWYCYPSRFRKIEPAKPKVNYRLANLEILTQFPVIRETSDQPLTQPVETQYEIEEV